MDLNTFIDDFNEQKKTLNSIDGNPCTAGMEWKSQRYKSDPEKYGFTVANGDMYYYSV